MTVDSFRPPTTSDPAALRQWGFVLVNNLRRVLEKDAAEIAAIEATAVDQAAAIAAEEAARASADIANTVALITLENTSITQAQIIDDITTAAQDAVDEIKAVVGPTLTDFNSLTDSQKLSLGLSQAVSDQLVIDDVIAQIQEYANSAGRAAIFAHLRDHQNQSAIRVQQTVSDGLATQVTTLTADLGATNAAVATETTARVNGDNANATAITTVQSTVAGHTATITEHTASIDGIEAEWGVSINLQGQVVGLVRLDADASESTFTVVVDKFQVAKTDGTGIVPIFQIGTVGGVSRVALAGNMIVDGSIVSQNIAAAAIAASNIAAGAVTAEKISVLSLAAIAANVGTITAGKLQRADGTMVVDLDNKIISIQT